MNKDILLATIIGFVIGLVLTGVVLIGPKAFSALPKLKGISITLPKFSFPKSDQKITPTTSIKLSQSFTIEAPLPESVESGDTILITGKARSGATVSGSGESDEDVTVVKEDGTFALKLTLIEGKNEISITEFLESKETTLTLVVYRSIDAF